MTPEELDEALAELTWTAANLNLESLVEPVLAEVRSLRSELAEAKQQADYWHAARTRPARLGTIKKLEQENASLREQLDEALVARNNALLVYLTHHCEPAAASEPEPDPCAWHEGWLLVEENEGRFCGIGCAQSWLPDIGTWDQPVQEEGQ